MLTFKKKCLVSLELEYEQAENVNISCTLFRNRWGYIFIYILEIKLIKFLSLFFIYSDFIDFYFLL